MKTLDFIMRLYNDKNCYSDHMTSEEIEIIHIKSNVEEIVRNLIKEKRIVFITGNPGDGKTFIIKALAKEINKENVYCQTDLNNVSDYSKIAKEIIECYKEKKPAVIAVNEYPFILLHRAIDQLSKEISEEIQNVKRNVIVYKTSNMLNGRIAIVDLNERNLLSPDYGHLGTLIDLLVNQLNKEDYKDTDLNYNIKALSIEKVKEQVLSIFSLASAECQHFAMRDILGTLAFALTACVTEENRGNRYYSALFEGTNDLQKVLKLYDPAMLSDPELDEKLWNGEVDQGWMLEKPQVSPKDYEDVEAAIECFRNIKRQYYFENEAGKSLNSLQPESVVQSNNTFIRLEKSQNEIKRRIVLSLNKLFLPTSNEKNRLCIWTTHRFDVSMDAAVAVSSKAVESGTLELLMPRPADWLQAFEYSPNHIILKVKGEEEPKLVLNIDFLRALFAVEKGYPVGLLPPQYEQAAAAFLQQLDDNGFADEYEDGEIIIASRNQSFVKRIRIQDGQYGTGEEED